MFPSSFRALTVMVSSSRRAAVASMTVVRTASTTTSASSATAPTKKLFGEMTPISVSSWGEKSLLQQQFNINNNNNHQHRSFSSDNNNNDSDDVSTTTTATTTTTDDDGPYLTGTVKFYLRNKLYGFIIPDDPLAANGHNEVWFHRTNIQSPHSFDEFPSRPYLMKQERVKFRLQPGNGTTSQSPTAFDITFENGRTVPLFRKNYLSASIKGEATRLGQGILKLFDESTIVDDDQVLLQQVKDLVAASQQAIQHAKENVDEHGQIDVLTGERVEE
ncbi:cold-shock DNA-binding domain protein [Nitzschia inconspicua]|uniref:Cold-shock DNA-binding domain protein n=1 Tax=Nitzschia inconspicua TaxID=303405 RepID=A0A9K3KLG7_9STRA|nr:cold-shock DNA-binding domain protein [Nitzschia inconspicua]